MDVVHGVSIGNAQKAALGAFPEKVVPRRSTGEPPKISKTTKTGPKPSPKKEPVLDPFWSPFWPQNGSQNGVKINHKIYIFRV